MKKPLNPFALVLCAFAGFALIVGVGFTFSNTHPGATYEALGTGSVVWEILTGVLRSLMYPAQIMAAAVLIELVDQIRWNALPSEKQVVKPGLASTLSRMRGNF